MLPSVVASELEQVAKDAISTFHPTTPGFSGLIERFLADREQLLKGPFVSVSLPFHQGSGRDWFPQIPLPFPPYRHQERAFERLLPGSPQNTLVATGTGSGKTECFLLPLLEHCRQQVKEGQRGIKAILIYPMNALATDQAKRIAEEHNQAGVLRYLVVDEFHSFDGAQGTDLACLIRRLRDRLQCPSDELVCVGTSATLGGPESREAMLEYAGQIFASSFESTSLIEEERLSPEEFFTVHTAYGDPDNGGLFALPLPAVADQPKLNPGNASSTQGYIAEQAQLWLDDSLNAPPSGDVNDAAWRFKAWPPTWNASGSPQPGAPGQRHLFD